ncbi:MAG: deoxyuridine 5'-triphosphate nucleotidohydrolase [Candidatus Omnitrophica bacterium]|nr:deoxyuridine 5'-triphosphate nucleotidohydrolase [Candidatus Omnitrophota bacterium]
MKNKEFVLSREIIEELIKEKGLVSNFIDLKTQLTPGGFDLTVAKIFSFSSGGVLDFSNKERSLPKATEVKPKKVNKKDKFGWWNLKKGCYKVVTNEVVSLPNDLMAIAFSRSSLLRMGVFAQNAVWDAGFEGKSEFMLVVENTFGLRLKENARVAQLVFLRTAKTNKGYQGIYKNL